jgi:hypothetical protein
MSEIKMLSRRNKDFCYVIEWKIYNVNATTPFPFHHHQRSDPKTQRKNHKTHKKNKTKNPIQYNKCT